MAKLCRSISKLLHPTSTSLPPKPTSYNRSITCSTSSSSFSSSYHHEIPPTQHLKKNPKKVRKAPKRLITISTSDGRWHDKWSCDYVFTLRELQLADLAGDGDGEKNAEVLITLSVQKHAGFGFSIDGRVVTSFSRKCSCCFSSYSREIDATFDVWVLPSSKNNELQLPEIEGSDPSVIYVKPGSEADLDSLIQDTIRLTASAKDTCSETCEKTSTTWQYTDGKRTYDRRWSILLELKNAMQGMSQFQS